jgi:hypothetical protein
VNGCECDDEMIAVGAVSEDTVGTAGVTCDVKLPMVACSKAGYVL